jgi:hypothetical protein
MFVRAASHRAVRVNGQRCLWITVQHRPVLDVGALPDDYGRGAVAADGRPEPHAGTVLEQNVPHDSCCGRDPGVLKKLWAPAIQLVEATTAFTTRAAAAEVRRDGERTAPCAAVCRRHEWT